MDYLPETLKKTTFNQLTEGDYVNVEPALKYGDEIGGHSVTGHIDTTGRITDIENQGAFHRLRISYPPEFAKYLIPKGSIAIDGISLTVVIDDETSIRDVIARILRMNGHDVLAFEDGAPALAEADFDEVDLVVTDLRMPTSGEQVIASLHEQGVQVPVIVLSGYLNDTQVRNLNALEVKEIMSKPFQLTDFLELVGRWT